MTEQDSSHYGALPAPAEPDRTMDAERGPPRSISAAERVREAILTGQFQAGERINEVHLSRALGVSRTPTRAALHSLAAEGLVDYAHNKGFTVREFPLQAVLDAYQIRASLEGLACRFAAERGLSADHRAAMEQALHDGDMILHHHKVLAEEHLADYRTMNVMFHDAILAAAQNRMLSEAVRLTLNMPGSSHRHIVSFKHDDVRRRHDDHHRIYHLISSGEGWRAEMLMREHVVGLSRKHI
jgi:GntR family transcriptional regulator, vanillate catabolism transcriptional regulator